MVPFRSWLLFFDINFISGSRNIVWFWSQSQHLTNRPYRKLAVGNMFGMPKRAVSYYVSDDSGISLYPHPASAIKPEDRIHYATHITLSKLLTGPGLKPVVDRFVANLDGQFSRYGIGEQWLELPDFCEFLQSTLLSATIEAVFGPSFLALNPNFCEQFWEFSKRMPLLSKSYPRWITPAPYKARDRCLASVKRWHAHFHQQIDRRRLGTYADWDNLSGAEIMKSRHEYFARVHVFDEDAIAAEDLGMIWGYVILFLASSLLLPLPNLFKLISRVDQDECKFDHIHFLVGTPCFQRRTPSFESKIRSR